MARPIQAGCASVGGNVAVITNEVHLPVFSASICFQEGAQGVVRRVTLTEQLEAINAILRIDESLCRDAADA